MLYVVPLVLQFWNIQKNELDIGGTILQNSFFYPRFFLSILQECLCWGFERGNWFIFQSGRGLWFNGSVLISPESHFTNIIDYRNWNSGARLNEVQVGLSCWMKLELRRILCEILAFCWFGLFLLSLLVFAIIHFPETE